MREILIMMVEYPSNRTPLQEKLPLIYYNVFFLVESPRDHGEASNDDELMPSHPKIMKFMDVLFLF